jgi:hypothetical protein
MEATKELIELGYTPEQAFEIVSLDWEAWVSQLLSLSFI